MTYTFALIKAHPQGESGWCLAIPAGAFDLTFDLHQRVATQMALKFFKDPHLFKDGAPQRVDAPFYHPIKLAAGWLDTCLRGLREHGTVYMNRATGLVFGEHVEVLETREREKLEFPAKESRDGVKIRISTWREGSHYYLDANNNQVFSKLKYDSYAEAKAEARKYAWEKNITFKIGGTSYQREGD